MDILLLPGLGCPFNICLEHGCLITKKKPKGKLYAMVVSVTLLGAAEKCAPQEGVYCVCSLVFGGWEWVCLNL